MKYPVECSAGIGKKGVERKRDVAVEGKGMLLKTVSRPEEERCELRCARNRRLITNLANLIGLAWSGGSESRGLQMLPPGSFTSPRQSGEH